MDEGTPIFAVADGEVVVAGDDRKQCPLLGHETTGLHVIVEHRASTSQGELVLRSRYSHFSRIDVQAAERVKQGAQIGISGNTGCSTGPHLHFEVQRLVPATRRFVRIDSYGWAGPGEDPWARHPEGAQSLWLWQDGQAPALFRENRSRPNEPTGNARVAITAVRWMGYNDDTTPNNEFVELTLDPRFAPSGTVDLTNFTLVNNRGDTFRFPARFVIRGDAPVRIFTGIGQNAATDLFWGRNGGVWDNMGDCAQLVSDRGGIPHELWRC